MTAPTTPDEVLEAVRSVRGGLTVAEMLERAGVGDNADLRRDTLHLLTCLPEWRNVGTDPQSRRVLWEHATG